jgi:hypothetical protein
MRITNFKMLIMREKKNTLLSFDPFLEGPSYTLAQ